MPAGAATLRNLVGSASAGDTIKFTNTLSGQIITLISGQIVLSNNVTIDGSALTNQIVLNGNHASRLFTVTNATVLLDSLTLTNGFADTDNNAHGDIPSNRGGGIYNYGNLIVNRCTFAGNHSSHGGGAINAIAGSLTRQQQHFLQQQCRLRRWCHHQLRPGDDEPMHRGQQFRDRLPRRPFRICGHADAEKFHRGREFLPTRQWRSKPPGHRHHQRREPHQRRSEARAARQLRRLHAHHAAAAWLARH